jgi:hypothetical protein
MSNLPPKMPFGVDPDEFPDPNINKTRSKAPKWEDLTEEEKAQYGSPMKYARKQMEYLVNSNREDDKENE